MENPSSSAVPNVGVWAMNVVSSVGIIMANKQLMSSAGYAFSFGTWRSHFISLIWFWISSHISNTRHWLLLLLLFWTISATTLTGFHFAVTAIVGFVSNAAGLSASKPVPLWELLWFSVVANTSITAMNLSLMLNSVGFYQVFPPSIIKAATATTPN